MIPKDETIKLRVWGDYACFTRPEMKVERVSYDVMTPSAARNILQAILWKPSFDWEITQIDVVKPVQWFSVRRNEVGAVISANTVQTAMKTNSGRLALYIEEERQQRAGMFLRDVEYVIHARIRLTEHAGSDESVTKFSEIFKRRAFKGQCFSQPYLGCREFAAFFVLLGEGIELPPSISDTQDLGWMLFDLDYSEDEIKPCFFRGLMEDGKLRIPSSQSQEIRR